MAIVTVEWLASTKLLKEELQATGKSSSPRRSITIDLESLEPKLRAEILELTAPTGYIVKGDVGLHCIDLRSAPVFEDGTHPMITQENLDLHEEPTATFTVLLARGIKVENAKAEAAMAEARAASETLAADRLEGYKAALMMMKDVADGTDAPSNRLATLEDLEIGNLVPPFFPHDYSPPGRTSIQGCLDELIRKLKREIRQASKAWWVEKHGSEHLTRATLLGYDCQRLYVKERATLEAPGFICDFDDAAEWKARSCPSIAALNKREAALELGLGDPDVVWLTKAPQQEIPALDEPLYFEPRETIVIEGYLGGYALIQGSWRRP